MNIFDFRSRLVDDYAGYTRGFIHVREPRLSGFVDQQLDEGVLWPEPLIQLNPSFEPGESVDELVSRRELHQECSRVFRRKPRPDSAGDQLRLHRHQSEAIRVANTGLPYVLTTGTGSGKSLAYIVPVVDHVLRRGSGKGIQAIIVYPMNALANSQRGELEKFLCYGYPKGNPPVRFARYTGQESFEERKSIQQNPSDRRGHDAEEVAAALLARPGYGQLDAVKPFEIDGKLYPISHLRYRSPIHLVGFRQDLDERVEAGDGKRPSPHGMVQELLNRSDDHLWAFVTNGLKLRVLRDNIRLTRQAFVEFDLQAIFDGKAYADFALLWRLCHESRVKPEKMGGEGGPSDSPTDCWLERWSKAAADLGLRALEQLRDGVERAIEALGRGFLHPQNAELIRWLKEREPHAQEYYRATAPRRVSAAVPVRRRGSASRPPRVRGEARHPPVPPDVPVPPRRPGPASEGT